MQKEIRNTAIYEWGNFVQLDSQGDVEEKDLEVLRQVSQEASSPGDHVYLNYLYALKNTAAPNSLDTLLTIFEQSNDVSLKMVMARGFLEAIAGPKDAPDPHSGMK